MKLRSLPLIAGLFCLPVASYAEGSMRISFRMDLSDLPAGNTRVTVHCAVGVGAPPLTAFATWEPAALVAQGAQTFEVPAGSRRLARTAVMPLVAIPPGTLGEASHFKCRVSGVSGQPVFRGPEVSGPIRR